MSRLRGSSSLPVAALFLASGSWWLANVALQAGTAFVWVPVVSADAIYAAVLGQWIVICLFTRCAEDGSISSRALAVLGFVLPLWPLLAVAWLSSDIGLVTLLQTQLLAIVIAIAFVALGHLLSRRGPGTERSEILRNAFGVVAAAITWSQRQALHEWLL